MRRTWRLLILAALMTVPLTGCERRQTDDGIPTVPDGVGGNAAEGGSPTPATTADVIAAMGEWAQCMRKQGFDVPDPYLDPEGGKLTFGYEGPVKGDPMEDLWVTALEVCESYELAYQELGREPFTDQQMELWLAFVHCMRDHGVEMDDPDQASGRRPFPDPEQYREQPAVVEQASQACEDEALAAWTAS